MSALIQHNDDCYFIDVEQGSPEWLALRRDKIGASDAPAIVGVSPWATPYQKWMEKLLEVDIPDNEHMKYGRENEPKARALYTDLTGIFIHPTVAINNKFDWMMASLDGYNHLEKVAVEIKCPGQKDHELAVSGEVPKKYYPQLQHQLAVIGLDSIEYFSYRNGEGVIVTVSRDDEYIENLFKHEFEFLKCMRELTPPPMTEKDVEAISDPRWYNIVPKYVEASQERKRLEKLEEAYKEELVSIANHKSVVGGGVKALRVVKKGNIDYSAIPELMGVDLEKYRKPSSCYYKLSYI